MDRIVLRQVTPGPNLITVTFVAFKPGGNVGAFLCGSFDSRLRSKTATTILEPLHAGSAGARRSPTGGFRWRK
jgi:hypothetical protein